MVEVPEQDCRSVKDQRSTRGFGLQVVSSCITIVLQSQGVDVELPGVGFNGSFTGVGVRFPGVIGLMVFLAMSIVPVDGELT